MSSALTFIMGNPGRKKRVLSRRKRRGKLKKKGNPIMKKRRKRRGSKVSHARKRHGGGKRKSAHKGRKRNPAFDVGGTILPIFPREAISKLSAAATEAKNKATASKTHEGKAMYSELSRAYEKRANEMQVENRTALQLVGEARRKGSEPVYISKTKEDSLLIVNTEKAIAEANSKARHAEEVSTSQAKAVKSKISKGMGALEKAEKKIRAEIKTVKAEGGSTVQLDERLKAIESAISRLAKAGKSVKAKKRRKPRKAKKAKKSRPKGKKARKARKPRKARKARKAKKAAKAAKPAKKTRKKSRKGSRKSKKNPHRKGHHGQGESHQMARLGRHRSKGRKKSKKHHSRRNPVDRAAIEKHVQTGIGHNMAEVGGLAAGGAVIALMPTVSKAIAQLLPGFDTFMSTYMGNSVVAPLVLGYAINHLASSDKAKAVGNGMVAAAIVQGSLSAVTYAASIAKSAGLPMAGYIVAPHDNLAGMAGYVYAAPGRLSGYPTRAMNGYPTMGASFPPTGAADFQGYKSFAPGAGNFQGGYQATRADFNGPEYADGDAPEDSGQTG